MTLQIEGYVRCALAQGLRPEHAIFIGLHPAEPEYTKPLLADDWYAEEYHEHVNVWVRDGMCLLQDLWVQQLGIKSKFYKELGKDSDFYRTQGKFEDRDILVKPGGYRLPDWKPDEENELEKQGDGADGGQ